MESEKVKEIKELFKNCDFTLKHCGNCVLWKDEDCIETIKSKVLTLINELESENEKLTEERDLYKKRIAELEKSNEALSFAVKQGFNDCKAKALKQFAERLKKELEEYRLENEYFIKDEPNGNLWQMNSSVFCIEVTQDGGLVDETLKEFIDD
jgi:DNA polymerase/3'-5' exonuclease PolX